MTKTTVMTADGAVPPAVEQRRDIVEHGHQRERQPDLERVRHPPRVVPRDPRQLPREPGDRAPEPVRRRAEPVPAARQEPGVALAGAAIVALRRLRLHGARQSREFACSVQMEGY
jgi:hypothetical protein